VNTSVTQLAMQLEAALHSFDVKTAQNIVNVVLKEADLENEPLASDWYSKHLVNLLVSLTGVAVSDSVRQWVQRSTELERALGRKMYLSRFA
jgi:hypothetical protein